MINLNKIEMQNFRGIKKAKYEFKPGINLIIGDNGAGKSSLINAIRCSLGGLVYELSRVYSDEITESDIRIETKMVGAATASNNRCYPMSVNSSLEIYDIPFRFGCEVKSDKFFTKQEYPFLTSPSDYDIDALCDMRGNYPLICYQSFDRDWGAKGTPGDNTVTFNLKLPTRQDGYRGCLNGKGNEDVIQRWCLKMLMIRFQNQIEIPEYRLFQMIVSKFIMEMEGRKRGMYVDYSTLYNELVFHDGNSETPLSLMSTGYKTALSLIMELAYRTALTNPVSIRHLDKIGGIVLIDEIDAHLHPKWQWKVLNALQTVFPSVQFIVATHSPIVIASAKNANIIQLGAGGNVSYLDNAYGYSANDVLAFRQGSTGVSEISKTYMDRLEAALNESDTKAAMAVVEEAREAFGEKSMVYQELNQYYKLNNWKDE